VDCTICPMTGTRIIHRKICTRAANRLLRLFSRSDIRLSSRGGIWYAPAGPALRPCVRHRSAWKETKREYPFFYYPSVHGGTMIAHRLADFLEFPPTHTCDGRISRRPSGYRDCPPYRLPLWSLTRSRSPAVRSRHGFCWNLPRFRSSRQVSPRGHHDHAVPSVQERPIMGRSVYRTCPRRADDPLPVQDIRARYHARSPGRIGQTRPCRGHERHVLQFGETCPLLAAG